MIGIRCERGSHRFFKRYGERFEDSEGKQIFLEFADEERAHLELLIREYRAPARAAASRTRQEAAQAASTGDRLTVIDLHLHTTASDGRLSPDELVARAAAAGLTMISVTDHDTTGGLSEAAAAAARHGVRLVNGIEITAVEGARDVHVLGYFVDPGYAPFVEFLRGQRADRLRRLTTMVERLRDLGTRSTSTRSSPRRRAAPAGPSDVRISRTRSWRPATRRTAARPSTRCSARAVPPSCRAAARRSARSRRSSGPRAGSRRSRIPG